MGLKFHWWKIIISESIRESVYSLSYQTLLTKLRMSCNFKTIFLQFLNLIKKFVLGYKNLQIFSQEWQSAKHWQIPDSLRIRILFPKHK